MSLAIGCDIGGSYVKIGTIDAKATLLSQQTIPLPKVSSPTDFTSWVSDLLLKISNNHPDKHLVGTGIGIPGPLLYPQGILHAPPNLPFKGAIPIREMIQKPLSFPVFVDNDATVQTLGEMWQGAGRGIKDFLYITFGTGIGGGIVLNGMIYRGADGMAGEFGHLSVAYQGRPCLCGSRGCLETYASLNGIANSLKELYKTLPQEISTTLKSGDWKRLPGILDKRIKKGETRWQQVWDIFADALGAGMGSLINLFNPEKIIISGGLSYYSEYFFKRAIEYARSCCFNLPGARCEFVLSPLKEKAGILGAAYLAFLETSASPPAISL